MKGWRKRFCGQEATVWGVRLVVAGGSQEVGDTVGYLNQGQPVTRCVLEAPRKVLK